jgi:hypothetical protein
MITKIISGGQTGADRGALDAAIKLKVAHGGWIPKGRLAEDGPLSGKYLLTEMPTESYPDRTEKNITSSEGTLILSHGNLTGGSKLTQKLAYKHKKPCLHIDLVDKPVFSAVSDSYNWIFHNNIRVLNVAGSSASKDPKIYEVAFYVVEGLLLLSLVIAGERDSLPDYAVQDYFEDMLTLPENLDEAVNVLVLTLDKETMEIFAGRTEDDLKFYYDTAAALISKQFKLQDGNEKLIESCRKFTGQPELSPKGVSIIILELLWHRLRQAGHYNPSKRN